MTTAQRIAARLHLEDARDSVTDARDGGPDGGAAHEGGPLYRQLTDIITALDRAINGLRF